MGVNSYFVVTFTPDIYLFNLDFFFNESYLYTYKCVLYMNGSVYGKVVYSLHFSLHLFCYFEVLLHVVSSLSFTPFPPLLVTLELR